ncbi:winged helix-turn-helix domain-containing protein [Sphingomonas arvum]|uniref:winged helix-turn-helix domain-containing protein n=1 Tax=Sphingomonas arvum TaxID=2992113 RepID=UPI0038B39298
MDRSCIPRTAAESRDGHIASETTEWLASRDLGAELLRFRHHTVVPGSRTLLCRGKPVQIGSRAFDLLVVLLRARGRVVSKSEIMRSVWPATFVGESNIRCQVLGLRRALGSVGDQVKTVSGRGYLLTAYGNDVGHHDLPLFEALDA